MTATMKRSDIHRPSAIIPEDYFFVGLEHQKIEGIGDIYAVLAERAKIEAHMKRTGGERSAHDHGGNCHICGAACIYTALFYHEKTNSYIRTGMDCATKLDMGDENRFRTFRNTIQAAREAIAGKKKAQGILMERGLQSAYDLYITHQAATQQYLADVQNAEMWQEHKPTAPIPFEERTICDIIGKLVKYGSVSAKQIEFIAALLDKIVRRPQIEAERKAEKDKAEDCPESGRHEINGEVIKTEYRDSAYGETLKMLVKTDKGFMLWGSVPSSLQLVDFTDSEGTKLQRGLERGDKINFFASLQRSDKDSKFGFFKRPTGGRIV